MMATWKEHILVGGLFVAIYSYIYFALGYSITFLSFAPSNEIIPLILIDALIVLVYSQLPDIDADTSIINKYVNSGLAVSTILFILIGLPYFAILSVAIILVLEWVRHRGIAHGVVFGILTSMILWKVSPYFAGAALSAFISHLILDKEMSWC